MNMILHGDGHSGVNQLDSLENPVDNKYDVVITNMPFSQKTKASHLYCNGIAKNSGDAVCLLHCFKAVKKGGRMAIVVPEGVLFKKELKNIRQFLMDNAVLKTVISLPQGCFAPYTGVKTNILYFTSCHKEKTKDKIYSFNVNNDGFSLNNKRKPIKDNDIKKIDYVDFNKKNKDENILDIGFQFINLQKVKNNFYDLRLNQYLENKISGVETIKLREIIDLKKGKNPKLFLPKKQKTLPYLNIDFFENKTIKYSQEDASLTIVDENEIVVVADGQRSGLVFLSQKGVLGSTFYLLINKKQEIIDTMYLFVFLKNNFQYLNSNKYGSAIPHLDKNIFFNLEIPLIPMEEQKQIRKKQEILIRKQKEIKNIEQSLNNDINSIWTKEEKEQLPNEFFNLLEKAVQPLEKQKRK